MKPQLTILTVNFNSSQFIENLLYALKHLTSNAYQVIIADNDSAAADKQYLKQLTAQDSKVNVIWLKTSDRGSLAHGTALDKLVSNVTTPYFSIMDADAVWLKRDWDKILINKINSQVKIVGTQAPPPKPQDFPLMYAALFETKTFKQLNCSFLPKNPKLRQDTGYQLKEKYLQAGFQGEIIEFKSTRNFNKGPFKDLIVAEYYLDNDYHNIFASHFGRGSNLGVDKYTSRSIVNKIPIIKHELRKRRGKKEIHKWLRICRRLIYDQR